MTTLAIVGAGGHGREAHAVASVSGRFDTIVFADDRGGDADRMERIGSPEIIGLDDIVLRADVHVIAIGDPRTRHGVACRLSDHTPATRLVAEDASVGTDVKLGPGVLVYPGAVITTNVRVGLHSHVNCGAIVSHDCRIGDFVSLSPGVRLNGEVVVESGAFLGTGAIVLPGRRIGQEAVVGAGAVVVDDVPPGATVVGVPAR